MAKSLREIEATAGPAIHTKSVGVDGLTTEEQPQERKQPKTRKLTVVHPEAAVEQEQPTEEQPQAEVEAPKPALYKCSKHHERFPGEAQMLPLKAFPLRAEDGKRKGVYCKRCQSKMHTAYQQRRRAAHMTSIAYLEEQIATKRTQLDALEDQLRVALEQQAE